MIPDTTRATPTCPHRDGLDDWPRSRPTDWTISLVKTLLGR